MYGMKHVVNGKWLLDSALDDFCRDIVFQQAGGKIIGPEDPIQVPELYATIMASMGIDARKEIMTPIGRPIRFADATPSARLLKDDVAAKVVKS